MSWLAFFVSLLSLFVSGTSAWYSRENLLDTQRPWVTVKAIDVSDSSAGDAFSSSEVALSITLVNTGVSLARNGIVSVLVTQDTAQAVEREWDQECSQVAKQRGGLLERGQGYILAPNDSVVAAVELPVSSGTYLAWQRHKVAVLGCTQYTDQFDRRHQTRFRYGFRPTRDGQSGSYTLIRSGTYEDAN